MLNPSINVIPAWFGQCHHGIKKRNLNNWFIRRSMFDPVTTQKFLLQVAYCTVVHGVLKAVRGFYFRLDIYI